MERSVKLLLTLLVLLGGLAAVPAQARGGGGDGSGIEQVAPSRVVLAESLATVAVSRARAPVAVAEREGRAPAAGQAVLVPAVRKGDRALE